MRVLVCGSRTWDDQELVFNWLDATKPDLLIHGGARGADRIASDWAGYHHVPEIVMAPEWEMYGKSAGIKRNNQMLDLGPDSVLAFWDGRSKGTKHTIDEAHRRGIPVKVIR